LHESSRAVAGGKGGKGGGGCSACRCSELASSRIYRHGEKRRALQPRAAVAAPRSICLLFLSRALSSSPS